MSNIWKRSLSMFLAIVMVLGNVPVQVFATEMEQGEAPESTIVTEAVETAVPETTAAETTVPATTVPETTVPETTVPETTVPETTVPETTAAVVETTAPVLSGKTRTLYFWNEEGWEEVWAAYPACRDHHYCG